VWQSEISRRREHEVQKIKKDLELMAVQHETSEASLRKRHQEALNELTDQLEQSNKQRAKSVVSGGVTPELLGANQCDDSSRFNALWPTQLNFGGRGRASCPVSAPLNKSIRVVQ